VPVAVGFGIKDAESAKALAQFADGVVVGSALVQCLAETETTAEAAQAAADFLSPLRGALDAG
jgi:tryptophan synthase alpha chain